MSFKFSETTLSVLRNFATINGNIYFSQGNEVSTITDTKNFMAYGSIEEEFPIDFGIYDLSEFLNVLSLMTNPSLDFSENYLVVNDESGTSRIKYFYSSPDILTKSDKKPTMPSVDMEFDLSNALLSKLKRAGSTLGLEYLSLTKEGELLNLSVIDINNATSNTYTTQIPVKTDMEDFNILFNLSNIRILEGNYNVKISKKLIAELENTEYNLKYWLACERTSTV